MKAFEFCQMEKNLVCSVSVLFGHITSLGDMMECYDLLPTCLSL